MTNTKALCTPGRRLACVAIFSTLFASFTVMAAQGTVIQRLEQGDHLNIAAIGTSLTDANFNAQNWFAQTGAWLSSKYPGQVTLSNRAVSGTASVNLPQYSRPHGGTWQLEQVLANDNPDAIFMEFAINDAYKLFNISPAASANNLKTLIDRVNTWATSRGKSVDVIVQTMNNTGPSYASAENDTAPYYAAWRQQAAASNVLLIDHEPNWVNLYNSQANHATWKTYITDDIHPNTLGTTNVILPEIQRVLMSQVPEPSCIAMLSAGAIVSLAVCCHRRHRKRIISLSSFSQIG
jgi:acyl-CoA thioesterase I